MQRLMLTVIVVSVIAGCGMQPPSMATPSPTDVSRSQAASSQPSASPSADQPPPTAAADGAHVGVLTRFCDLGACCPALDVDGTWYGMQLPNRYRWRHTESGYVIRDRRLNAEVAAEGDVIVVRGSDGGPQICWAAILVVGLEVTEIARTAAD